MGVPQGQWQPAIQQIHLRSACISQVYTTEVKSSTISPSKGNNTRAWEEALVRHPDREFVEYLLQGIQEGFCIGFNYQEHVCKPAAGNMKSASEKPGVVDEYLANEREAGRLLGPLAQKETEGVQISPFGVIPKSHQPGKWRLSYPHQRGGV